MSEPLFVTERLELWRPEKRDIDAMIAIVMAGETARYLGPPTSASDHFTRFLRNAGCWDLYGYGSMTVRERGKEAVVGNCGIFHSRRGIGEDFDDMAEAGWIMSHDHTGKGYAAEAMHGAIAHFASGHAGQRIMCIIDPENAPSIRLADKLGFTPRGKRMMGEAQVLVFDRLA